MAYTMTSSRSLASQLFEIYYGKKLPQAKSADSQQGTPLQPIQDQWLVSRIQGGSGQIAGRSGDDTWWPVSCY